jgi:class 3 adenylate cyclase
MKRITYISRFSRPLTAQDIEDIGAVSVQNNTDEGLTGALMTVGDVFYQILEGLDGDVDRCFERISLDERHTGVFVLQVEPDIARRDYPEWGMKTIRLDQQQDVLMRPMRALLASFESNHRVLERYTSNFVQKQVQRGIDPSRLPAQRTTAIVLFSDIVGSTVFSELLAPEKVVSLLRTYYDVTIDVIERAGGEVLKLTGDGLMARFGIDQADAAKNAAEQALIGLARLRKRSSGPERFLAAGFGLTYGPVIEGNIGSGGRLDYTIMGDTVNLAARLESWTRNTGRALLFSVEFQAALSAQAKGVAVGKITVRGKAEPVMVYTSAIPEVALEIAEKVIREGLSTG